MISFIWRYNKPSDRWKGIHWDLDEGETWGSVFGLYISVILKHVSVCLCSALRRLCLRGWFSSFTPSVVKVAHRGERRRLYTPKHQPITQKRGVAKRGLIKPEISDVALFWGTAVINDQQMHITNTAYSIQCIHASVNLPPAGYVARSPLCRWVCSTTSLSLCHLSGAGQWWRLPPERKAHPHSEPHTPTEHTRLLYS